MSSIVSRMERYVPPKASQQGIILQKDTEMSTAPFADPRPSPGYQTITGASPDRRRFDFFPRPPRPRIRRRARNRRSTALAVGFHSHRNGYAIFIPRSPGKHPLRKPVHHTTTGTGWAFNAAEEPRTHNKPLRRTKKRKKRRFCPCPPTPAIAGGIGQTATWRRYDNRCKCI